MNVYKLIQTLTNIYNVNKLIQTLTNICNVCKHSLQTRRRLNQIDHNCFPRMRFHRAKIRFHNFNNNPLFCIYYVSITNVAVLMKI